MTRLCAPCSIAMEMPFTEIPDWTCCGASAAETVSPLLGLALSARNLALARRHVPDGDILVPCSACYLNLMHAREKARQSAQTLANINFALQPEGLAYDGGGNIRHLLDFLKHDLDPSRFAGKVRRPLKGLVAAPYYGCQCLRPYRVFDDPEAPVSMEPLLRAAGVDILTWSMGNKCCGASHMTTKPTVGIELSGAILSAARGADVIVTVCPMCQMNLEAYQRRISRHRGEDLYPFHCLPAATPGIGPGIGLGGYGCVGERHAVAV